MTSPRNLGLPEGRPDTVAKPRKGSRPRALIGLAAAASVITAAGVPLASMGAAQAATATPSAAGSLTFRAVADAYVSAAAPNRNAGADTKLVAGTMPGAAAVSYLKFAVTGIPTGRSLAAQLVLHRTTHHLPSALRVSTASSSWSEMAITKNNAPAVGSTVADVSPESAPTTLSVNVSSVVKGNATVTFAVTDRVANTVANFYSRQDAANAPSLVVKYGPAPTPSPTPKPTPTPTPTPTPAQCTVSPLLVPSCGAWWGIGATPLGSESYDQALTNFEATQGRASDILHFYHTGTQLFPSASDIAHSQSEGKNQLLMENWKPELGNTWAQVAAGVPAVDQEIDNEAAYIKANYTKKFFLSVHHEPENEIIATPGSGYTAADYAAMYRHVVLRLKADGITNAVFVMDYMGYSKWCEQSWFADLYPGNDVVDWIAYDPYSTGGGTFATMADGKDGTTWAGFYNWATTAHPGTPLMLAEWGVTETTDPNAKANFFDNMPNLEKSYPAIKALVYWNSGGYPTRIDSSPQSLAAYRALAQNPLYNTPLP